MPLAAHGVGVRRTTRGARRRAGMCLWTPHSPIPSIHTFFTISTFFIIEDLCVVSFMSGVIGNNILDTYCIE